MTRRSRADQLAPVYRLMSAAVLSLAVWGSASGQTAKLESDSAKAPGTVVGVDPLGTQSPKQLHALLAGAHLSGPTPAYGVDLYRVRYVTRVGLKSTVASGLVALPELPPSGRSRGTVVYLHGTNPDRSGSPSHPDLAEGVAPAAIFAGAGYMLVAPDYVGLGASQAAPAYLNAQATADATIDLLKASKSASAQLHARWNSDLYLVGFSQGGHAVAAVQREIERSTPPDIRLRASVAISGAYDLAKISVPYALKYNSSLYLAYVAYSISRAAGEPLSSLFTEKYAALAPRLFDGSHSSDEIDKRLPKKAADLFLPKALEDFKAGRGWFAKGLAENQTYDWTPRAPMRLYFGSRDHDVDPQDSKHFFEVAKARDGNVELINLGPLAHTPTAIRAVPLAKAWFDELSKEQPSDAAR